MVVGDEVLMSPIISIAMGAGAVLLSVIGFQYIDNQYLQETNTRLTSSISLLNQNNEQHKLDLHDANLRYVALKSEFKRERSISSHRENAQSKNVKQLNWQLNQLRTEVDNVQKKSKSNDCMRTRMPDYAIRLLSTKRGTNNNVNKDSRKKSIPTKAVVERLP